jgi:1-acyl-sn-glycerol-3-phosphate acyltransferase
MALELDWIGAWAKATERELGVEAFQRDVGFLAKILPLMDLWSHYFDAEVRGLDRVPSSGPVLLVGNHSGGPLTPDTAVFFAAWYRARGLDSALVALAFDAAFGIPWFKELMRKIGEVPASRRNAARALDAGFPVLVYPGGDHECFRPWTDRGRIDLAGRKGFVELALRKGVPVVPVVSHGGHHSTYIVTRGDWLGPRLGSERIRTKTFPWAVQVPWGLSPILLPGMPLPAKITIEVGTPMPWAEYGPEAADDPTTVERCFHEISGCMQATLDRLAREHPYPVLSRLRRLVSRDGGRSADAK